MINKSNGGGKNRGKSKFSKLDERWIYSHTSDGRAINIKDVEKPIISEEEVVIPESYKYAIVMTVPMEFNENQYAPTPIEVTSTMGYSRMHMLAGQLSEFIRGLGWHASPCGNDTAISVPIAIQAGLGHMGRMGRLITWDRGPLVRVMKIFTDLPLPQSELAHPGIIKFCEDCAKCAKHCPSQAIPFGPRTYDPVCQANNPGVLKWYGDEEACLTYWNEVGSACSVCFRTCSFTKKQGVIHDVVKWVLRNIPQLNKLIVSMDDIIGYGKAHDPEKYWDKQFKRT